MTPEINCNRLMAPKYLEEIVRRARLAHEKASPEMAIFTGPQLAALEDAVLVREAFPKVQDDLKEDREALRLIKELLQRSLLETVAERTNLKNARAVMHRQAMQLNDKDRDHSREKYQAEKEIADLKFDNKWLWMWFKRFLFVPEYTLAKYGDIIKNYPNCPWKGDSK